LIDTKKDGVLDQEELLENFKYVMLDDLNDGDVHEIVNQTIKFADQDGDSMLNFEEFKMFYNNVLQITI